MVLHLDPELEAALSQLARQQGVSPETLAADFLRERILGAGGPEQAQDEWERRLLEIASDCGVSLSHSALSRQELYD